MNFHQHSRYQSAQANRDVKSEICPPSQLSSTSGTQRPVSHGCSLGLEKVTVSVVPIMDGNSRMGDALTFLPMHLKHLFLKKARRLIQSRENTVLSGCFMETYQKQNAPLPTLPEYLFSTMRPVCHQAIELYARLIDANIDLLMPSPFIRNPWSENSTG